MVQPDSQLLNIMKEVAKVFSFKALIICFIYLYAYVGKFPLLFFNAPFSSSFAKIIFSFSGRGSKPDHLLQ